MNLVHITKKTKLEAGSCSFCTGNEHRTVYVLRGDGVESRICNKCLDKLKKEAK